MNLDSVAVPNFVFQYPTLFHGISRKTLLAADETIYTIRVKFLLDMQKFVFDVKTLLAPDRNVSNSESKGSFSASSSQQCTPNTIISPGVRLSARKRITRRRDGVSRSMAVTRWFLVVTARGCRTPRVSPNNPRTTRFATAWIAACPGL